MRQAVWKLPLEHLLDLSDLLVHFAGQRFRLTFACQVRTVADPPDGFFHFAFHFVESAFDLVLCARFHVRLRVLQYWVQKTRIDEILSFQTPRRKSATSEVAPVVFAAIVRYACLRMPATSSTIPLATTTAPSTGGSGSVLCRSVVACSGTTSMTVSRVV
jgi:hypothetical protein